MMEREPLTRQPRRYEFLSDSQIILMALDELINIVRDNIDFNPDRELMEEIRLRKCEQRAHVPLQYRMGGK